MNRATNGKLRQTQTEMRHGGAQNGGDGRRQVDVLDLLPKDHPGRGEILGLIQKTSRGIVKYQDPASGLWWQVLDKGGRPSLRLGGVYKVGAFVIANEPIIR